MTNGDIAASGDERRLVHAATVLRVEEDTCDVRADGRLSSARFAPQFPTPRSERVSPGHLVAVVADPDGVETVLWRWYDAVVVDDSGHAVRLWEPAHGEVDAQRRRPERHYEPGSRAYLSAGLPGADWWVAGPVTSRAEDADVELDEIERLYAESGGW